MEGASDEARFGKDNDPMFEAPIPIGRPNDLSFLEGKPCKTMPFPILKQWLELGSRKLMIGLRSFLADVSKDDCDFNSDLV